MGYDKFSIDIREVVKLLGLRRLQGNRECRGSCRGCGNISTGHRHASISLACLFACAVVCNVTSFDTLQIR